MVRNRVEPKVSQQSSAPNKKQSGSEKKTYQVLTSQMTSTSGGARGVDTTKDVIDPENIATHPFFYGMKFVELNRSLSCISFSDGNCLYNLEYAYVSFHLRVQNRRRKWHFLPNF